jgi:hypothetical protein
VDAAAAGAGRRGIGSSHLVGIDGFEVVGGIGGSLGIGVGGVGGAGAGEALAAVSRRFGSREIPVGGVVVVSYENGH